MTNDAGDLVCRAVPTTGAIARTAALARTIWTEYYTPIIGAAQVTYMLDRFQSSAAIAVQIAEGMDYRLLILDGKAVGYLACRPEGEGLFLSKFYVAAAWRRRGVGRSALDWVVAQAQKRGLVAIRLTVNRGNTTAIAAYRALGFRIIGDVAQDIGGGFVMNDHAMELMLPA